MVTCKILFHGSNLRGPVERLIKCFHEISKTPFTVKWMIDGTHIDSAVDTELDLDLALAGNIVSESSSLEKHSFVLDLASSANASVGCIFHTQCEPPFSLLNHIHHIHRHNGLVKSELIYHSYRNTYGCHRVDSEGIIDRTSEVRDEGRDFNQVDSQGKLTAIGTLDLDSSATFMEKVPKGAFAKFLLEHNFEY